MTKINGYKIVPYADLRDAYLRDAYLLGADLRCADMRGASLEGASLEGADLRGAKLPSPTTVLQANWCEVSDKLCTYLMRWDALNHPNPRAFSDWASSPEQPCPYNGANVQRAALFAEKRDLWSPGHCPRPYSLMAMVLREKCIWEEE